MRKTELQRSYAPAPAEPTSILKAPASEAQASGKGGRSRALVDDSSDEAENKAAKDKKAPVCSVKVIPGKSQRLGDSKALLAVIRRVAEQQGCAKVGATLRLRITVDATGKITKVERLAGDQAIAAAIVGKLIGQSSTTTAQAAPEATLELTIKF